MALLVPSDAGDGDGDFPTTLPAWPRPMGITIHGQGSNIPFGESLTLISYAGLFSGLLVAHMSENKNVYVQKIKAYVQKIKAFVSSLHRMEYVIYKEILKSGKPTSGFCLVTFCAINHLC